MGPEHACRTERSPAEPRSTGASRTWRCRLSTVATSRLTSPMSTAAELAAVSGRDSHVCCPCWFAGRCWCWPLPGRDAGRPGGKRAAAACCSPQAELASSASCAPAVAPGPGCVALGVPGRCMDGCCVSGEGPAVPPPAGVHSLPGRPPFPPLRPLLLLLPSAPQAFGSRAASTSIARSKAERSPRSACRGSRQQRVNLFFFFRSSS